jgi:flagellar protein FliS
VYETAAETYRRVEVTTAGRGRLVVLLYEALLKNLKQGRVALAVHNMERANRHLVRAQEILNELACSLDPGAGPVTQNLFALYQYCNGQLLRANVRKEPQLVDQVISILTPLFEAWKQVATITAAGEGTSTAPVYRLVAGA